MEDAIEHLAKEIAEELGSDDRRDLAAIQEWLLDGGDDGSPVGILADTFDMNVGLPSKRGEYRSS